MPESDSAEAEPEPASAPPAPSKPAAPAGGGGGGAKKKAAKKKPAAKKKAKPKKAAKKPAKKKAKKAAKKAAKKPAKKKGKKRRYELPQPRAPPARAKFNPRPQGRGFVSNTRSPGSLILSSAGAFLAPVDLHKLLLLQPLFEKSERIAGQVESTIHRSPIVLREFSRRRIEILGVCSCHSDV